MHTHQTRARTVRHTNPSGRLKKAAQSGTRARARFLAVGNQVLFHNQELRFRDDTSSEAPLRALLTAAAVEGDRNALSAEEVAKIVADALNRMP